MGPDYLSPFSKANKRKENNAPELSLFQAGIEGFADFPSFHLSSATMMELEDPQAAKAQHTKIAKQKGKASTEARKIVERKKESCIAYC